MTRHNPAQLTRDLCERMAGLLNLELGRPDYPAVQAVLDQIDAGISEWPDDFRLRYLRASFLFASGAIYSRDPAERNRCIARARLLARKAYEAAIAPEPHPPTPPRKALP
jgi:hypothetical protein